MYPKCLDKQVGTYTPRHMTLERGRAARQAMVGPYGAQHGQDGEYGQEGRTLSRRPW